MKGPAEGKIRFTLDLRADLVNGLRARAKARGMTYTAYLERLIQEDNLAQEGPNWHEYQAAYQSVLAVSFLTEIVTNQYGEEVTDEILKSAAETMEQDFGAYPRPPKPVVRPPPEK